jgi:uncharacterized protein YutD
MDKVLTFQGDDGNIYNDLLYSNEIIEKFHFIVMNSSYPVYAISGDWGTGKTCFIKMWENLLKEKGQIFVHIDAFKMDYEVEPFIMLIKALNNAIKKMGIEDDKIQQLKNKARDIFSVKSIAKLGLNILLDKTVGIEPVKEFVNNAYNKYFDETTAEGSMYDELVSLMREITKNFKEPVHIIIDELDRCRPDFALETLERIKHIFSMEKVKFILVYNEEVLKSIIKKRYGDVINAERYLNKFVQKVYCLDNTKRLKSWYSNELGNANEKFKNSFLQDFLGEYSSLILSLKEIYGLSLRDIQKIISNLKHSKCSTLEHFYIITSIEILKYVNKVEYDTMVNYCKANGRLSSNNTPVVITYKDIIKNFKVPSITITFDEAFHKYYDDIIAPSYCSNTKPGN